MSISASVREQLLNSFRAELEEHIQTMTDGLLALEQGTVSNEDRQAMLVQVFRAAHSLKGAARAVGVTMIEQLAHALESILDAMRCDAIALTTELFTTCYQAFDMIKKVQADYETGSLTPPPATLQMLLDLESFCQKITPSSAANVPASLSAISEEVGPLPERSKGTNSTAQMADPLHSANTMGVSDETIRVKTNKLDSLMAHFGELMITKIRSEQRLAELQRLEEDLLLWQKDWLAVRGVYNRLLRHNDKVSHSREERELARLLAYFNKNQEQLREFHVCLSSLSREYSSDILQMEIVVDELETEAKRVRMLPFSTISASFPRMVRDMAQESGKQTLLRIVGNDTELDKRVLEQIKDPLIHLLRNAVDHGILPVEQRQAKDKSACGTITLKVEQLGKDIKISVADDGEGLDFEAIRRAVALHDAAAAASMSEADLKAAIFDAGISTNSVVTDFSGRGMGLSVVRRNVDILHGRVEVDSSLGEGVTFTLTLPLALSSSRGLLVRVAGECFAIPLNTIERIDAICPQDMIMLAGHAVVSYQDYLIPLVRLSDVLELPLRNVVDKDKNQEEIPFVVLSFAEQRVAFALDALMAEQEIVIKGLGAQLLHVAGIAGATLLGSGEVVLVLNVADLIKMALQGQFYGIHSPLGSNLQSLPDETESVDSAQIAPYVLIVDDSITTRMLEKNILEAAGYRVCLATDGLEAWDMIVSDDGLDLVISDVSMPRLGGVSLTQRIKRDPRFTQLPVILVTSLDSPADKFLGIEAGADAYIIKGAFDQKNLLATIEQLI